MAQVSLKDLHADVTRYTTLFDSKSLRAFETWVGLRKTITFLNVREERSKTSDGKTRFRNLWVLEDKYRGMFDMMLKRLYIHSIYRRGCTGGYKHC